MECAFQHSFFVYFSTSRRVRCLLLVLGASQRGEDDHVDAERGEFLQEIPETPRMASHRVAHAFVDIDLALQEADESPEVFRAQPSQSLSDEEVDPQISFRIIEVTVGDIVLLDEFLSHSTWIRGTWHMVVP